MAKRAEKVAPPSELDEAAAEVWRELVAAHPRPEQIVGPDLEVYCGQVALARDCRDRVATEGAIIEGSKREPVAHPAIALGRQAQDYVAKHAAKYSAPPPAAKRRTGPVYDATKRSVTAAAHLRDRPELEGAIAAVVTLAWLIDEAQRAGLAALEKAAFGTIPSYIKGCAELLITPATLPAGSGTPRPAPSPPPTPGDDTPREVIDFVQSGRTRRGQRPGATAAG